MQSIDLGAIAMGLVGGLALFLYGMDKLTDALKLVAGDRLKGVLAKMTTNRFKGVVAGALITATIQSSSVTTVLVVGFISAGLLSLAQSVPIIMGAEIGTTVTAQIIAFKVTHYSLILVAAGFALAFFSKRESLKNYGATIMGLGLIFFGMQLMKDSTSPLTDFEPFVAAMQQLTNPILAVGFSALFTALVQSSSATTGLIIVLASQGLLSLEAGIPLVFGANIGTCVTAFLASIGKPREAVRAAVVHILFNTAGVLLWIGLIPYLADFVRWISPVAAEAEGLLKLQQETPRQIANAHTTFNVSNTLIFIGFAPLIARWVERLVPDRELPEEDKLRHDYMDDILVHTPSLALDLARLELVRLGARANQMVEASLQPVIDGTDRQLDALRRRDTEVDELHRRLVAYLSRLSLEPLAPGQSKRQSDYLSAANYFENIADIVETNLVDAGKRRVRERLTISESTRELLAGLHREVVESAKKATQALAQEDRDLGRQVVAAKSLVTTKAEQAEARLAHRLGANEPDRLSVFSVESEIVEAYRRIYYFAKRVAKLMAEEPASEELSTAS